MYIIHITSTRKGNIKRAEHRKSPNSEWWDHANTPTKYNASSWNGVQMKAAMFVDMIPACSPRLISTLLGMYIL